jgi:hypothetical protein
MKFAEPALAPPFREASCWARAADSAVPRVGATAGGERRLKKLLCVPFCISNLGGRVAVYEPEEVYDGSFVSKREVVYG